MSAATVASAAANSRVHPDDAPLLSASDRSIVGSAGVLLVGLAVLVSFVEGVGEEVSRLELPVRSMQSTVGAEPDVAAELVRISPEFQIDRASVVELRLEREGGDGWVMVSCALVGSTAQVREVSLQSGSADERLSRAWIDRVEPGSWTLRAETIWTASEIAASPPTLVLSVWRGRRSPYTWFLAGLLLLIPPGFVLLRAAWRWLRRRRSIAGSAHEEASTR